MWESYFKEISKENVLLGVNLIYQILPYWEIAAKSSFNWDAAVRRSDLSGIIYSKVWSLAYPTIKKCFTTVGSWWIYRLNKGGDQIVPWGTPAVTGYKVDKS